MNIKKILTSQAEPGMIVAEDVYTFSNQLIISKNTQITDRIITRLKFYSIQSIKIVLTDEHVNAPDEKPVMDESYSEKVKKSEEFKRFNDNFIKSTDFIKNSLNDIVASNMKNIDTDALLNQTNALISGARNGSHMFDMLHCMRDYDDLTYAHSVNVALICNVLGRWLKFSRKDLDTLTLCGLLHDIGKISIPPEIVEKPGKLTDDEFQIIKMHTLKGYETLKNKDINIHVQMSAMMHHERCDGSGYPMGIKSAQIDRMAKVVMVADVYDALTSARVYRGPLCPFEAIRIFEREGLSKYDPRCIMTFLEHVNDTYLNNRVLLNNKQEGVIIMTNHSRPSKPLIKIGKEFLDLNEEEDLFIEKIL